jgi:hypothetical protein
MTAVLLVLFAFIAATVVRPLARRLMTLWMR